MVPKTSRVATWVQHKKWIPEGSMGCVHTHQGRPTIERCGSPNHVRNVIEKTKENNQKVRKINRTIS
jgi:hypothetical protein